VAAAAEVAQTDRFQRPQAGLERITEQRCAERSREQLGEQSEDYRLPGFRARYVGGVGHVRHTTL
jgi:hypothetical protein